MGDDTTDHDLLIKLDAKIDSLLLRLGEIPALEVRVRSVEIATNTAFEKIRTIGDEVNKLRTVNFSFSMFNTVATAVVALFLGTKP